MNVPSKIEAFWDAYWSSPGKFHIDMFKNKPQKLQQILQYFADAKSLQMLGKIANRSYRFLISDFARYFRVHADSLARNVARLKLYQEFLARSAQETAYSTAQQQNGGMLPIPCLPAISIVGDGSAPGIQQLADYLREHGPEDAAVPEADAWSLIASDATVAMDVSAQSGVAGGVADAVQHEEFVLPEQFIQNLEAGMLPTDMSMIHLLKQSRTVDATELQSEGSLVLGDFPRIDNQADRAAARTALREQGHYFVDGRSLAEKAANSENLKHVMPGSQWYPLFFPYLCVDHESIPAHGQSSDRSDLSVSLSSSSSPFSSGLT
jgi:hypothetical protein